MPLTWLLARVMSGSLNYWMMAIPTPCPTRIGTRITDGGFTGMFVFLHQPDFFLCVDLGGNIVSRLVVAVLTKLDLCFTYPSE